MRARFLFATITILLPTAARAAEQSLEPAPPDEPLTLRAFNYNDGTYYNPVNKYDRHSTGGAAVDVLGRPAWLEPVSDALPFADPFGDQVANARTGGGMKLGYEVYTPQDITLTAPIANDMPFAAYGYVGGFWQRETELGDQPDVRVLEHVELDAGMIGPSMAGHQVQHFIHRYVGGRQNPGWVNQLSDEPTLQLYLRRKWVLDQDFFGAAHHRDYQWELIPDATLAGGTVHDSVNVGCEARFGVNLPHDFGTPRTDDPGTPGCDWGGPGREGNSFYVFTRVSGSVVAHDTFTDGSLIHPAPTSAGSQITGEPLRADATFGLRWCGKWGRMQGEFGYYLTVQSKQFTGERSLDSQGTFSVAVTARF